MNQQTIQQLTDAEATALSPMYPGQLIYVTSTGGAFLADNYYRRNAANSAWARMVVSAGTIDTSLTFLAQGEIRLADSDSSNYEGWKAPAVVTANKIWTLPDGDGTANQVMKTNGSAVLSWGAAGTDWSTYMNMYPGMELDSYDQILNGTGSIVNRSGIIELLSGATTGGDAGVWVEYQDGGGGSVGAFRRDRVFEFHTAVYSNNSTIEAEVGLTDQITGAFSGNNDDFAVFVLDRSVSANWFTRTNDNGAVAPAGVDTGTAHAGAPTILSIISDETDIKFYINGILEHTATTDLPTATTHIYPKWWAQCETCSNVSMVVWPWVGIRQAL